eukprot:sb/3472048/
MFVEFLSSCSFYHYHVSHFLLGNEVTPCQRARWSPGDLSVRCLRYQYFIFIMVTFMVQVSAIIAVLVFKDDVKNQIKEAATTKLAEYGNPIKEDVATKPLDVVQAGLKCCGIDTGPIEWATEAAKATYWIRTHDNDVPDSCCVTETTNCGKNEAKAVPDPSIVYTEVIMVLGL